MATDHRRAGAERSWLPGKGPLGFGVDFAFERRPNKRTRSRRVWRLLRDGSLPTLFWSIREQAHCIFCISTLRGTLHKDPQAVYGETYLGPKGD